MSIFRERGHRQRVYAIRAGKHRLAKLLRHDVAIVARVSAWVAVAVADVLEDRRRAGFFKSVLSIPSGGRLVMPPKLRKLGKPVVGIGLDLPEGDLVQLGHSTDALGREGVFDVVHGRLDANVDGI